MSMQAVSWAIAQRAPSSASKALLIAIAEAANPGDWLASPSVMQLCDVTQQDRKTVLKNLQQLQGAGLIRPAGKAGDTAQVNVWRLPINEQAQEDEKRFLTLRAAAALVGFELMRTDARDGVVRYFGTRWGSTQHLGTDLNTVEGFVRVMGGVL